MSDEEKLRRIADFCRLVIETEDEVGYDVRAMAKEILRIAAGEDTER